MSKDGIAIDLGSADYPSISASVNKTYTILSFVKTCDFILPTTAKNSIWPDGPADAADRGITLTMRPWVWWILLDDTSQLSVTYEPSHGNTYVFTMSSGILSNFMKITEDTARELFTSVKELIHILQKRLNKSVVGIFTPSDSVMKYHTRQWRYHESRDISPFPPRGQFPAALTVVKK